LPPKQTTGEAEDGQPFGVMVQLQLEPGEYDLDSETAAVVLHTEMEALDMRLFDLHGTTR
jgi:hypothetical protein